MNDHTLKAYGNDLQAFEQVLLRMGEQVCSMLDRSTHSLLQHDCASAQAVIDQEAGIVHIEAEIETRAIKLFALFQPVANDLRFIASAIKVSSSLSRIAEQAVNICEQTLKHASEGPMHSAHLREITALVQDMLRKSLQALATRDIALAHQVCQQDDLVDTVYERAFNDLNAQLCKDANPTTPIVRLMLVARYLERCADHAVNIAERTIYLINGSLPQAGTHAVEP